MGREAAPAGDGVLHVAETAFKWAVGIFLMLTLGFLLGLGRDVPEGPDDRSA